MALSAKQAELAERRGVVVARRVERIPFATIAADLGISESTARADYERALRSARTERNKLAPLGHPEESASLDAQEAAAWEVLRRRHVTVSQGKIVGRFTGFAKHPDTDATYLNADGEPIPLYEELEDDAPVLAALDRLGKIDERRRALRGRASDVVESAMRRQLDGMTADVRESPLAHVALRLAAGIDAGMSPRDSAAITRELRLTIDRLLELSPARGEGDFVDELVARREARLAAAADR